MYNPQSLNRWSYAAANPVMFVDPSGRKPGYDDGNGWVTEPGGIYAPNPDTGEIEPDFKYYDEIIRNEDKYDKSISNQEHEKMKKKNSDITIDSELEQFDNFGFGICLDLEMGCPPIPMLYASPTSTPNSFISYAIPYSFQIGHPLYDWGQKQNVYYLSYDRQDYLMWNIGVDSASANIPNVTTEFIFPVVHITPIKYEATIVLQQFENATVVNIYEQYVFNNTMEATDGIGAYANRIVTIDQVTVSGGLTERGNKVVNQQVPIIINYPIIPETISIAIEGGIPIDGDLYIPKFYYSIGTWKVNQ